MVDNINVDVIPIELDSAADIDAAINAFGHSVPMLKGVAHLPPGLSPNVAIMLRALRVYQIVVGVNEDLKRKKGDD